MSEGERLLQGSVYTDDDGAADPALTAALADYAADPAALPAALAALSRSRVLVPVVAVLGEVEIGADGLARDKSSDMAAVLMTGADGRRALLAFSGTETLRAWDPDARPVPVPVRLAAATAVQEGAAALVVDVAGPRSLVVEGDVLHAVAVGAQLVRVGESYAWIGDPGESSATIER